MNSEVATCWIDGGVGWVGKDVNVPRTFTHG